MARQERSRTLFDKVWSSHVVTELAGGVSLLAIDRHLLHDLEGGASLTRLAERGLDVRNPELTYSVPDHAVATAPNRRANSTPNSSRLLREMKERSAASGITYFDLGTEGQGIVHVIGPELGLSQPGMTIVCGDSHTCTHGGLGALSFGIGATEIVHVLATQTLRQTKPKTMRITLDGRLAPGVAAKDVILATIGQIGTGAGSGHAVEFAGTTIRAMSIDQRLTVCNLSIELGAKIGMIAPDDTTFSYLAGRPYAPKGEMFDRACAHWRTLPSDGEARFDAEHAIDAAKIAPQITWGTSPQDVIAVDQRIPDPARENDPQRRQSMEAALAYMGLTPGEAIEGTPVDWVFVGSCTNGRLSDIREAARVVAGRNGRAECARLGRSRFGSDAAGRRARGARQDFLERRLRMAQAGLLDVRRHQRRYGRAGPAFRIHHQSQLRGSARDPMPAPTSRARQRQPPRRLPAGSPIARKFG